MQLLIDEITREVCRVRPYKRTRFLGEASLDAPRPRNYRGFLLGEGRFGDVGSNVPRVACYE